MYCVGLRKGVEKIIFDCKILHPVAYIMQVVAAVTPVALTDGRSEQGKPCTGFLDLGAAAFSVFIFNFENL
jgi:hypothetical protein